MTLEELKAKLKDEKDTEEQMKLKEQIKKLEEKPKDEKNDSVPYYKFKRLEEKFERAISKLDDIEKINKEKDEETLKEQGKYKELANKKDEEIKELKGQLKQTKKDQDDKDLSTILLNEIDKELPQNASDILQQINREKVTVEKKDGKTEIQGIKDQIDQLREGKPWLFKGEPNDQKNNLENKLPKVENESLNTRFRELNAKPNLTMMEQQEFNKIGLELQKKNEED